MSRIPLPVDHEVLRMRDLYARAHHVLHVGGSGLFSLHMWGVRYEIEVRDGRLTARPVKGDKK